MGAGISAMHYSGMAAIDLLPQLTYEPVLFTASILIAIAASFAALWLFFQLRNAQSLTMKLARVGAAFAMGFAISGMHYTGMAASRFSPKSFCTGTSNINSGSLAVTTGVIAFVVLAITTLFLVLEGRRDNLARERVARIERSF
jgi:NO-binding membrane sensor protein with MHYT domain